MIKQGHGTRKRNWIAALAIAGASMGAQACGDDGTTNGEGGSLGALMADGDATRMAPGGMMPPGPGGPPAGRFCPSGDCARDPLAFWRFEDCGGPSTQLADSAFTSPISHPAFRAVSVACAPGADGQGLRLAGGDDVAYAPDQPDFVFDGGLTVAAWVNPDGVTGTQSLVRKRLDGTSSFLLAIDGRKVHLVVRLTNGRFADVTGAIAPGRFTHVAGTYDGNQAVLYIDGAAAATARARGTIAAGAGPILIGNDANGRQFKGVVDSVWLNTLAAPADTIKSLMCIHRPPVVSLTPGQSAPQTSGATVEFDLAVTNTSSDACPAEQIFYGPQVFYPLAANSYGGTLTPAPGQTAHATVQIGSVPDAKPGAYPFSVFVYDMVGDFSSASATYVVGSTQVSTGIPLVADQNGHYDGSNAAGVVGYWWSTGDDYGLDGTLGGGDCRKNGFPASACSVLNTPTPGTFFQPDATGRMCTSGVTAQVVNGSDGLPAWSSIWGNIIGFDVNNPGGISDGTSMRGVYDAPAHGVTGFAFDIDSVPMGGHIRVGFQTQGTENNAAYYGGANMDVSPVLAPGHYEIRWPSVGGPLYLGPMAPPFDPTKLDGIFFHVVANNFSPVPFSFCVSNPTLLTN